MIIIIDCLVLNLTFLQILISCGPYEYKLEILFKNKLLNKKYFSENFLSAIKKHKDVNILIAINSPCFYIKIIKKLKNNCH